MNNLHERRKAEFNKRLEAAGLGGTEPVRMDTARQIQEIWRDVRSEIREEHRA